MGVTVGSGSGIGVGVPVGEGLGDGVGVAVGISVGVCCALPKLFSRTLVSDFNANPMQIRIIRIAKATIRIRLISQPSSLMSGSRTHNCSHPMRTRMTIQIKVQPGNFERKLGAG